MTSYMYNPSKKVTEILSKFFEFDPSELELGIWSGDIQLKNVKLRQETIHPLLNRKANKPHTDPLKKAPLHLKLVSGTVGHMRIRIPWKRLVWGQGAVQIEISDVMIVLSMQSREETEEQRRKGLLKQRKKKQKTTENDVSEAYRDAKQRRLREAERRHMQGMPVGLYLDTIHRKNSIQREAAKSEKVTKEVRVEKQPGRIDKWLSNTGSDLFWRFFAGIQGSITKARIVVVQDGVEVGCIVQSINIIAGKDGTQIDVNMEEDPSDQTEEGLSQGGLSAPETMMYEGEYDDGEHVDKTIKQQGLGLFVRKVVSMAEIPKALRFSTSVSADDYILRPVDLDVSFSFFYPYPPERRKKRPVDSQSHETSTTAGSSSGVSAAVSISDSTTNASSKRRRGKRERDRVAPNIPTATFQTPPVEDRRANMTRTASQLRKRALHRRIGSESSYRPQLQRLASQRSARTGVPSFAGHSVAPSTPGELMSVREAHTGVPERNTEPVPKFECQVSLKTIRIVFSTRQYELLNYFLSTVARMKNGRPDQMIRSTPKETDTALLRRKFIDTETRLKASPDKSPEAKAKEPRLKLPNASMLSAMIAPLTGLRGGGLDTDGQDSVSGDIIEGERVHRSLRSQARMKWWKYAFGAILWEVRKRKHLTTNFREMYISFDWARQRHKRKEYIELYIAHKLQHRSMDGVWPFESENKADEELLRIEDELPLEQILLYRSIARTMHVRGMTKMPETIAELHVGQTLGKKERQRRRTNAPTPSKEDDVGEDVTLLSIIQEKYETSMDLRLPEGAITALRSSHLSKYLGSQVSSNDSVASSEAAEPLPPGALQRDVSGFSSSIRSERDFLTPSSRRLGGAPKLNNMGSFGFETPDIQPGNYYSSSNRKESHADVRTIRTNQKREAKSVRLGNGVGTVADGSGKSDDNLRISVSLQIKSIELTVVKEEYIFDISPDQLNRSELLGSLSKNRDLSKDYFSDLEESSSHDVSELSVLTDDQRFFNDENQIGVIAEEEEENEEGHKMSSTDFLRFGLPENPLLRLTIDSLGFSVRGRSGGPIKLGASIRRIDAVAENGITLFSMGGQEPRTPMAEVNLEGAIRRRSFDSLDFDLSSQVSRPESSYAPSRSAGELTRALTLAVLLDGSSKEIQSDVSGITFTLDLVPLTSLLKFYSDTDIKFPDKILEKSSGDVARKFMVYKTTSGENLGSLNTAIRVYGLKVVVPLRVDDETSSEASELDASTNHDHFEGYKISPKADKHSVVFGIDEFELYGGSAVDDICSSAAATQDFSASRGSLLSGSRISRRTIPTKTLNMLDVVELTSNNDSFSCNHWVSTMGGISCNFKTPGETSPGLLQVPVNIEILSSVNATSLLDTELPKNRIVVEVSPAHVILSKERLDLLSNAKSCLDFGILTSSTTVIKKRRKPDPPRIEILARRILHSLDLNCRRIQASIVKDDNSKSDAITDTLKEVIMEECLGDFLSIVSCFDFSLPNEEALSSAMQVCIGRLVGLGLSDDEAWSCTNAARLNFLDDIALMRRAQSDILEKLAQSTTKIHDNPHLYNAPVGEDEPAELESCSSSDAESSAESSSESSAESSDASSNPSHTSADVSDDENSANSYDIVETTLHNAVEKTVATFSHLLASNSNDTKTLDLYTILTIDLPLGLSTSAVKFFYDQHISVVVTSLVVTNSAGIELMTLVPRSSEDESEEENGKRRGLMFSRYDLDKDYDFGAGGLPMSALADDDEKDLQEAFRARSRNDDIVIGEIELIFSSKIYEQIIDELSKLNSGESKKTASNTAASQSVASVVTLASSVSVLFTSDELTPFCRMTLEMLCFKNAQSLKKLYTTDLPSWFLGAEVVSLQNLAPEGQYYPDVLTPLTPNQQPKFPFEIMYYKSPDPWQQSSRLSINFTGFRLFLLRSFIYEVLHFFVYDRYGVGRLKKKYSKDVRDIHGNQKPPLHYTVRVFESSVVCPRCSTSSDMVAFEVREATIAVSYIHESFRMPSDSMPFDPLPRGKFEPRPSMPREASRRSSFVSATSEFYECVEELSDDSQSTQPISAFSKDLKKRLTIQLNDVGVFTVIAKNRTTREKVESSAFRYFNEIDGRAVDGKRVYRPKTNVEHQSSTPSEAFFDADSSEQCWEEISVKPLTVEVFADSTPHMRLLIASRNAPVELNPRLSQFCLLVSIWDANMQEMPSLFPFVTSQVTQSAKPPAIPSDFPRYCTEELVQRLEDKSSVRSEICCLFQRVSLRCTFDAPGHFPVDPGCFQYFEDPYCSDAKKSGLVLTLEHAAVHVVNDFLNVRRIGVGSSALSLVDERRAMPFRQILSTEHTTSRGLGAAPAWADVEFGLRNDIKTLNSSLPMAFQLSVFMSPGWSQINVGAESANGIMHELSWIWLFLDYFKSYYTDVAFGNPGHQAQRWTHKLKNALRKANGTDPLGFEPLPGVNVDFRLWLCKPFLTLPSDYHATSAPSLRIESETGLWYRYKSVENLSSQEVTSTNLNLYFENEFQHPSTYRNRSMEIAGSRVLIQNLSFGLRYDSNNDCNHKDLSLVIPYGGEDVPDLSVNGSELEVNPICLPGPSVCKPAHSFSRSLGTEICEITCIIEVLPITSATFMNFFSGPAELNEEFVAEEEDQGPPTYTASVDVHDFRVFAIDPVLGVQLPVAVVSIASLQLTSTQLSPSAVDMVFEKGQSMPEDMQVTIKSLLWADYFKLGMTRSWEPLLEPFESTLTYEKSEKRGDGYFFNADTPFHLNLSGALLQVVGDTIESFSPLIQETFGEKADAENGYSRSISIISPSKDMAGALVTDTLKLGTDAEIEVQHEIPKPLKEEDRVAFSLRNLTGQKVRVHQQVDRSLDDTRNSPAIVTYLNDNDTMGLTFAATISVVKNMSIVEVPYPGLQNSANAVHNKGSLKHAVDMQIPGFAWVDGIKVDAFGRKFEKLRPKSNEVHAKLIRDWRLANAMMILTEVGLDNGGRLVTIRSLFEIKNCTTHPVRLVFDPDPRGQPPELHLKSHSIGHDGNVTQTEAEAMDEIATIQPGSTFQVPTLLLEQSLRMSGSHLGCFWLCPDTTDRNLSFWDFFRNGEENEELQASFCGRPVQLARVVYESSVMFQEATEDVPADEATSGVQVSCPMRSRKGDGRAPFCYAIEVGRSPLVGQARERPPVETTDASQHDISRKRRPLPERKGKGAEEKIHGPVAYSLSIHAPLVIVNLLPEGGRFELMHATRRTVVWYADLQPGQQIPVHSVGLDAPLLLLVNLGFCRTPVGEGALVHHGVESTGNGKEQGTRFKSIGKAALKGTKQIGKTLTAISDSPDRRAQGRLAQVHASQFTQRHKRKEKGRNQRGVLSNESLGLDGGSDDIGIVGGKVHSVETVAYSPEDIATETTVVDSVGQRLSLKVENVRGGGGQRRISLFCPFWIVNTTEHSLRYKQEKGKAFVSGTVSSPERDGSRPVDGSNRNYRQHYRTQTEKSKSSRRNLLGDMKKENSPMNTKTIFPGTPGALATSPGCCRLTASDLSKLIEKDLPLERIAQLAFMFNFYDEGLSIGNQMLSTQLFDGSGDYDYASEWSSGFSLDSVGFSQIVTMNTREGRAIELSVEVNVAPGFLSSYTKIVRFMPRYVVLNRLERPLRLWQDSSVFRPVHEDRVVASDLHEITTQSRKWRYEFEIPNEANKVHQYELLYGRPAIIVDRNLDPRKLTEGTTAHRSALYISTVGPGEMIPFVLPDTRAERQLRLDLGHSYNVSSSFASDLPGEHTLKISPAVDLRLLNHVSTRAAPKYKIVLPPPEDSGIGDWDGELGVFFETDWGGDKRIIVKGTKRGRFAYNHTDIHIGDELLRVDGISVLRMSFAETMKLIKDRLVQIQSIRDNRRLLAIDLGKKPGMLRRLSIGAKRATPTSTASDESETTPVRLTLTFRTLEERLRKLRVKAGRGNSTEQLSQHGRQDGERESMDLLDSQLSEQQAQVPQQTLNVETKSLHNTMFFILREQDKENPSFQIQNRSINHIVFYRQRGCDGHPWNILMPGKSLPYSWEEPMRSKKLTVRLASKTQDIFKVNNNDNVSVDESFSDLEGDWQVNSELATSSDHERQGSKSVRLRQALGYQFVDNEERGGFGPPITVRLEEIGYRSFLPLPSNETGRSSTKKSKFLNCEVDTDGGTRLLIISDDVRGVDDRRVMEKHIETLKKQIGYEQQRIAGLHSLQYLLSKEGSLDTETKSDTERVQVIEEDARRFVDDFAEDSTITSRHQVVVQVLEVVGLNPSEFVATCNPYCEIFLKGRSKSRQYFFQKRRNKRKTYFLEKSLHPKWTDQTFVFDVPQEAVKVTRGHHLQIKVRNFRHMGQHSIMGQAVVHFGSLRNQQELVGWYPLAGRSGRNDAESIQTSDGSRGCIKLRVQWIYTLPALIDYFCILSQERMNKLAESRDGLTDQLSHAIASDERRRDAKGKLAAGRIQKLAKLEKKISAKTKRRKRNIAKSDTEKENVVEKLNNGLNTSLTALKGTLKGSRDRYLYALYYQTAESKRRRQSQIEGIREERANTEDSVGESTAKSDPTRPDESGASPPSDYPAEGQKDLEDYIANQRVKNILKSPHQPSKTTPSLDDFFSKNSPVDHRSPYSFGAGPPAPALDAGISPRRVSRRPPGDGDLGRFLMSHRRLSLDMNEPLDEEALDPNLDRWQGSLLHGRALYDGLHGQTPDLGISDLISVSTDVDEEAKRKRNTRVLMHLGFVFHEHGVFFHENHLPRQFRRSLFASSLEDRRLSPLYRARFATGSNSIIRHFKSWQAAGALHIDPAVDVKMTKDGFVVSLKERNQAKFDVDSSAIGSKELISQRLGIPGIAPEATKRRSSARIEKIHQSRLRFERAANRSLGAVLNPGGWMTVRPITALNLPDAFTGMFVKLRYGAEVLVSETVNAKVTPRWGEPVTNDFSRERMSMGSRKSFSHRKHKDESRMFQFTENDLHVHVEPQQTSGRIKISVVAERLNTKTELGVIELPLGEAIAACLDEDESDRGSKRGKENIPTYTRWFPLLDPQLVIPVEGDMGLGARPSEKEHVSDSAFQQYFTPCIQLALMWWPDNEGGEADANDDGMNSGTFTVPGTAPSLNVSNFPKLQSYCNIDVSRVSAALIDSQHAVELLSLAAMDIDVRYSATKSKTRVGLVVGWIQLDHQESRAREPVILAPTPTDAVQPTLQILALRDNLRTKSNIVSYEYIGVSLQEMDLTVEESWIFELWDFFMGVMRRRKAKKHTAKGRQTADFLLTTDNCFLASDLEDNPSVSLLSILEPSDGSSPSANKRKIYIEQLILGLVKINLSYIKGKKQPYDIVDGGARMLKKMEAGELPTIAISSLNPLGRHGPNNRGESEVFLKWSQHSEDGDFLDGGGHNLPGMIAAIFPSVSDAPIRLQGKVIDHVFESSGEIVSSIKNFYVNETLKQVYKIIGSLDFVGNPTIIFSSFVSGVRDLVAAPTSAFLKSPTNVNQVGIAVGKGTLSLFSHSASGIFGFVAKMSATAGQAAAILSLDAEYRQWHRERIVAEASNLNRVWKRRGVQSVPEMVTRPIGDILMGVAMGTTGLVVSPYKGFKRHGGWGFVTGVFVGVAGIVAKPIVGVLDGITHFSATVHDVAKSVNVLERRFQPALRLRLPYVFGPMNILTPFDANAARSVNLLSLFPLKLKRSQRRLKKEKEVFVHAEVLHMEPGVDTYAVVTTLRVVLFRLRKDPSSGLLPSLGWQVDFMEKDNVSSRIADHGHNGVALTVTKRLETTKTISANKEYKGWRAKKAQDILKTSNFSSALSIDSNSSDSDSDDVEEDDNDDFGPAFVDAHSVDVEPSVPTGLGPQDAGLDQGATEKEGEVFKWYTVLGEYQHRKQLTAIHNAVCCILTKNEDTVPLKSHECNSDGSTKFGIFFFDKSLQNKRVSHTSNAMLLDSLENLPWMHEEFFVELEGRSLPEKEDFVASLSKTRTFETDLQASERAGGPAWLVEARARGMFVQSTSHYHLSQTHVEDDSRMEMPDFPPKTDNSVHTRSSSVDSISMPSETVKRHGVEMFEEKPGKSDSVESSDDFYAPDNGGSASKNLGDDDDLYFSFHATPTLAQQHIESASSSAAEQSTSQSLSRPVGASSSVATYSYQNTREQQAPVASHPITVNENPISRHDESVNSRGPSRIERMENLMEQLVVLNAQQVQKTMVHVPNEILSEGLHSIGESRGGADLLRQELSDLRSQVQARKEEDDALRNEIALLRQQLADRRKDRGKRKIPEMLRILTTKKNKDTVASDGSKDEVDSPQQPSRKIESGNDDGDQE